MFNYLPKSSSEVNEVELSMVIYEHNINTKITSGQYTAYIIIYYILAVKTDKNC